MIEVIDMPFMIMKGSGAPSESYQNVHSSHRILELRSHQLN